MYRHVYIGLFWFWYRNRRLKSIADRKWVAEGLRRGFAAHRLVLASASPVFAKMLQCEMKEAQTRKILIEDVLPEVVAKALRFMYTGAT